MPTALRLVRADLSRATEYPMISFLALPTKLEITYDAIKHFLNEICLLNIHHTTIFSEIKQDILMLAILVSKFLSVFKITVSYHLVKTWYVALYREREDILRPDLQS